MGRIGRPWSYWSRAGRSAPSCGCRGRSGRLRLRSVEGVRLLRCSAPGRLRGLQGVRWSWSSAPVGSGVQVVGSGSGPSRACQVVARARLVVVVWSCSSSAGSGSSRLCGRAGRRLRLRYPSRCCGESGGRGSARRPARGGAVVLGSGSVESGPVVLVEVVRWCSILARVRGSKRGRGRIRTDCQGLYI